jgi:hypothetical protein
MSKSNNSVSVLAGQRRSPPVRVKVFGADGTMEEALAAIRRAIGDGEVGERHWRLSSGEPRKE